MRSSKTVSVFAYFLSSKIKAHVFSGVLAAVSGDKVVTVNWGGSSSDVRRWGQVSFRPVTHGLYSHHVHCTPPCLDTFLTSVIYSCSLLFILYYCTVGVEHSQYRCTCTVTIKAILVCSQSKVQEWMQWKCTLAQTGSSCAVLVTCTVLTDQHQLQHWLELIMGQHSILFTPASSTSQ